jgi:hypothetical protein
VPGSEAEFRRVFEPLAMVDVAEARKLLQSNFARSQPDLAMPPTLSTAWLASTGV